MCFIIEQTSFILKFLNVAYQNQSLVLTQNYMQVCKGLCTMMFATPFEKAQIKNQFKCPLIEKLLNYLQHFLNPLAGYGST